MKHAEPTDSSPLRSYGFRLWHVQHAYVRRLEAALTPLGLTHMQFVVLRAADYLAQAGERPTQARIAEMIVTDRMMVSKVLRLLEGKAMLVRPVHPGDARAHHVVLTDAGRRLVTRAVPLALRAQSEFFGRLGAGRMAQLDAVLNELLWLEGCPIAGHAAPAGGASPASGGSLAAARQGGVAGVLAGGALAGGVDGETA